MNQYCIIYNDDNYYSDIMSQVQDCSSNEQYTLMKVFGVLFGEC